MTVARDDLELVGADLQGLGQPGLIPAGPLTIPPGGEATLRAEFALPPEMKPDARALRALNVRVSVESDGERYASSVTFDRRELQRGYAYYAPYEYGYWGFYPHTIFVVPRHHHG